MQPLPPDAPTPEALRGPDGEWYPVMPHHRRGQYRHYYLQAVEAADDARLISEDAARVMAAECRSTQKATTP